MRRRDGFLARLLAALALAAPLPSTSQEATAPSVPARQGPEIVSQSEIPVRADADERYAREVIERSAARDPIERLGPPLEALAKSVAGTAELFKGENLQLLSVIRLESLARHWNFHARQLVDWRRELNQVAAQFPEDAAELARRRATWEATRAAAGDGGMAPALANRIQAVLVEISLAEQSVSGPIDQQIRLSRRANAIEHSIRAGQKAVGAAIAYSDLRLTRIDSPPYWKAWDDSGASGDGLRSVRVGLEVEQGFLEEYNAATTGARRAKDLLALALLPLLLWLSRRSRRIDSDDPEIQASTRVLRRPISSWILLVLGSVLVFDPEAPILLYQVVLLLALVPVLRLLPPAVYEVLGPWPYVATGLYLLQQLSFVFTANPLYHRTYLLFVTVLSLVLTVWLLLYRRPVSAAATASRSVRLVRGIAWLAVMAFGVSAGANILGNVSLAEMLTVGLLDAGYVGLVLYAGVTVLASVLRLLLARRAVSKFRVVTQHAGALLNSVTRLLQLGAAVTWVLVVLNQFRLLRPLRDAVTAVLTYQLRFGQISITLGGVLLFLFAVWLAFWAAKTVRLILHEEVLPKMSLPRGVGNSISSLTYYAMVILGLMVALAAAGFEVSQLALVVGALGIGIGLGLQNVVNNFVSGLILMFERPIQPGDVVEVSGTSGKVREIGMRATTLSTFEGADVVVPNGVLLNEKLINWTLSDMDRRIDVNVGVAYGNDPRRVLELLMEVTRSTPGITDQPAPAILFSGFGVHSLDFAIRSWTNNFGDWVTIRSDLHLRVYEALRQAGIEIPFPQQDLHLRTVSAAAGELLAGRRLTPDARDPAPPEPDTPT